MKFDEKSIFFLNPPFFYFHGNCGKVCPTDCDFLGLSHSTRCGCRDKPKKSESVGQTLPQLPWKQKKGDLKKNGFLSSNFSTTSHGI
jgi:hypothetical protein